MNLLKHYSHPESRGKVRYKCFDKLINKYCTAFTRARGKLGLVLELPTPSRKIAGYLRVEFGEGKELNRNMMP